MAFMYNFCNVQRIIYWRNWCLCIDGGMHGWDGKSEKKIQIRDVHSIYNDKWFIDITWRIVVS